MLSIPTGRSTRPGGQGTTYRLTCTLGCGAWTRPSTSAARGRLVLCGAWHLPQRAQSGRKAYTLLRRQTLAWQRRRAAECARDRVRRLVFVDALALLDGEKIRDIVAAPAAIEGPLALGPDRADLLARSFKDIAPALRDWATERVTLHPRNCFYAPVRLDSFWTETWDADVIYCLQAPNPGRRQLERCAEKLGARWHEFDTGHYPMLTTPAELARLLMAR